MEEKKYEIIPLEANIDNHNHTKGSDGRQSSLRFLLRASHNGKNIVAITDHDSVEGFKNLENDLYSVVETVKSDPSYDPTHIIEVLENIKLITGTELITSYQGVIIEILGYGIDIEKMRNEIKSLKQTISKKPYEVLYEEFKRKIEKYNLTFDITKLDKAYRQIKETGKGGVGEVFYNELASHPENDEFLMYEENGKNKNANTYKLFIDKHLYNKKSKLFIDMSKSRPTYTDTLEAIHRAGGKAFLAHPGRYMNKFNVLNYLDEMIEKGLEGIEVYYPDHSYEFSKNLLKKVKEHGIYASGGSDDHHSQKEGIQYDMGRISIPQVPETNWIKEYIEKEDGYIQTNSIMQKYINELKMIRDKRKQRRLEDDGR